MGSPPARRFFQKKKVLSGGHFIFLGCDIPGGPKTVNPKIIKTIKKQSKKQSNTHFKNGTQNVQKQSKKLSKKVSKISQNYQKTIKNQSKQSKIDPKTQKWGFPPRSRPPPAQRRPHF